MPKGMYSSAQFRRRAAIKRAASQSAILRQFFLFFRALRDVPEADDREPYLCFDGAAVYPHFISANQSANHAWAHFYLLKSERAGLDCHSAEVNSEAGLRCDRLIAAIERRRRVCPTELLMIEVFEVEMALMQILPAASLRAKVWSARMVYRKLVGPEIYKCYEASNPPDPAFASIDKVRADVSDLIKGKHWWYTNAMVMENGIRSVKKILIKYLVFGFFTVLLIVGFLLSPHLGVKLQSQELVDHHHIYFRAVNVVFLAIYAGMLGAVISMARRLKNYVAVPMSDTDPFIRMTGMENGKAGMHLSIISGAAFAVVLYFLFLGGIADSLLGEGILPKFPHATIDPQGYSTLEQVFGNMIPVDAASLARLLVWSFIAGFGEKFVPDILDRLSHPAQEKTAGTTAGK